MNWGICLRNELLFVQIFFPSFHACVFFPLHLSLTFIFLYSHLNSFFPLVGFSIHPIHPLTTLNVWVNIRQRVGWWGRKNSTTFGHFRLISWSADRTGMHLEVIVTPANRALLLLPLTWHHHHRFKLLLLLLCFFFSLLISRLFLSKFRSTTFFAHVLSIN